MSEINESSLDSSYCSSTSDLYESGLRLPCEVLEEIFRYLDGKSLLSCKRVCKFWRDCVHLLEQRDNFWYQNCQKEIPSSGQIDLLDNVFPKHWKDQSEVNWEEIYKCWYTWSSQYGKPTVVRKFLSGLNGITAMKISGEWLLLCVIGVQDRLSAQNLNGSELIDIYVSSGKILNFELVNSDRKPYSTGRTQKKLHDIFDSLGHNEIWLECTNCYIQLGKTYCHTIDRMKQKIKHSYGYEVRLMNKHHYSMIYLKKVCAKVSGPEIMEADILCEYEAISEFWMNRISLYTAYPPHQVTIDNITIDTKTQECNLDDTFNYEKQAEDCFIYSWHGSLTILFTSHRNLVIQYGGEKSRQKTPLTKALVTSVLFYTRYLFLGTDRGQLLIYDVGTPEACVDLIIFVTPSWEIQVCSDKIVHIAIAESVHHKGERPVIVCGTPQDVYFVST